MKAHGRVDRALRFITQGQLCGEVSGKPCIPWVHPAAMDTCK